jgi:hypothetical protein
MLKEGRKQMFLRWTIRKLLQPKRGDTMVMSHKPKLIYWRPNDDSEWRQDISISANIVSCCRVNGKPRQLHLHTFGPISESEIALSETRCRDFWRNVVPTLRRLRATPEEIERITRELETRVSPPYRPRRSCGGDVPLLGIPDRLRRLVLCR